MFTWGNLLLLILITVFVTLMWVIYKAYQKLTKPKVRRTRRTARRSQPATEQVVEMTPEQSSSPSDPVYVQTEAVARWTYTGLTNGWVLIANAVVLGIALLLITTSRAWMSPSNVIGFGVLGFHIWYTIASFRTIEVNRLAFLLFLGDYDGDLKPGMLYAPLWISKVIHVTTEQIEQDLPDSPERIYHGDTNEKTEGRPGDGKIPDKYTPALRVTFPEKKVTGQDTLKVMGRKRLPNGEFSEEIVEVGEIPADDTLLKRQTVEVELSYAFKVVDLLAFYTTIGDIDSAEVAMDDQVTAGFSSKLPKRSLAETMFLFDEISWDVKRELVNFTRTWGIVVTFARNKPFGLSHEFNKALVAAAAAMETKKATITASEGRRDSRRNDGIGEGDFERNRLKGVADGQRELVAVATLDGGRTQAIQGVVEAYGRNNLVVAEPGNFLGAIGGAFALANKNFPSVPTPPPAQPAVATVSEPAESSRIILTDTPQARPAGRSNQNHGPRNGGQGRKRR